MKSDTLSKRLEVVSHWVRSGEWLADIGTDHAQLPIAVVQRGLVPGAIAGEIVDGPYLNAKKAIEANHLADQIKLFQGDGLQILQSLPANCHLGTITICGMGGHLTKKILNDAKRQATLPRRSRLVLQPNNHEYDLREWLADSNYHIIGEEIIKEKGIIYEVIVAETIQKISNYSQEELKLGPCLLKERSPLFIEKWMARRNHLKQILRQMKKSSSVSADKVYIIEQEIENIEEILS